MSSDQTNIAGASDIGRNRHENQDHFLIANLRRQLQVIETDVRSEDCDELYGVHHGRLLLVADGMGGHSGGEVASGKAVQACSRYVLDMMHWFLKLSPRNEEDFIDELEHSLDAAQRSIWGGREPRGRDSGTTLTMAYILDDRMYVVHAGDSRCYLHRDGELKQLTTDHTIAQRLLDDGAISEADAQSSNWRHVLWNCVGGSEKRVRAEVTKVILRADDRILLCSDGLTGMISDDKILQVLETATSPRAAVSTLVDAANAAGGKDNITVVIGEKLISPSRSSDDCFDVLVDRPGNTHDTEIPDDQP